MSDDLNKLIGSLVTVVTKVHCRYTGTLVGWDADKAVVWLRAVRGFGTEGRAAALGEDEVLPYDELFEEVEFNGSDLSDLRLADVPGLDEPEPVRQVGGNDAHIGQPGFPQQQQQQHQQHGWGPDPSHAYPPPPPHGAPPPFPGPGGPYGYNQPMYPGQDPRWAPPMPMGGPPHGPPHGPPPPFGGYGMYGGPQYPPYGQPGGPNFPPPPPGGRPFPNEPYQGYPPHFPGQAPPPVGAPGHQQPFPPQEMPAPAGPIGGRQPLSTLSQERIAEPKNLSTQPPHPPAPAAVPQPQPVQHQVPSGPKIPAPEPKVAVPSAPTGPKNAGKIVPAMPLTQKPAPREPAKTPTAPAPIAPARSAVEDATQAATAAVAAAMAKLPPLRQNGSTPFAGQQRSNDVDQLTRKVSEMRTNDNTLRAPRHPPASDAGFAPRGVARGGAPRGRGGPRPEPRKVEVPKDDFDFESSNAKFNKQDLVKEVIAGDSAIDAAPVEEEVPETAVPVSSYNKKSSFFDDLSSEAKDRADGEASGRKFGREWRGEEQKRNVETFGQGSVDNGAGYRGGMRGRGRGRGGPYRGRGGGGYANGQPGRGRGGYQSTGPPRQQAAQ